MIVRVGDYQLDDDPARIDAAVAVWFLTTEAYWARWRGEPDIRRQIAQAWRVVGAYDRAGAMVGFARAFGDEATVYLADVFVLSEHRGAGLGEAIVRHMIEGGPGAGYRWLLHTADAHGLYRRFGFTAPDRRYLERRAAEPGAAARANGEPGSAVDVQPLIGKMVRLEPLRHAHRPALLAASTRLAAGTGDDLYRWSPVPVREDEVRRWVETAIADRDRFAAVPFTVIRIADNTVIGSTRFWNLDYWAWPDGLRAVPDTCEIGHTWLSRDAIRTGVNTEMKLLMLTYAFETWQVSWVSLHTDERNQRSRDAMHRIGARYEGVLRAHRLGTDQAPRNSARFSITAAEWPAVKKHLDELSRSYT